MNTLDDLVLSIYRAGAINPDNPPRMFIESSAIPPGHIAFMSKTGKYTIKRISDGAVVETDVDLMKGWKSENE